MQNFSFLRPSWTLISRPEMRQVDPNRKCVKKPQYEKLKQGMDQWSQAKHIVTNFDYFRFDQPL